MRALETKPLRHRWRIELALSGGGDVRRHRAQPPVDQVEMVRRLVNHQPTGVFLVAMPAPEVIGAVAGVKKPVKVDGEHVTLLDPEGLSAFTL